MREVKKSIMAMQGNLNYRLRNTGTDGFRKQCIYNLSTQLDKEIVKYYRSIMNN